MRIGVDWGGTSIKVACVEEANVLSRTVVDTRVGAPAAEVLDDIASAVLRIAPSPDAVGVAIPGEVRADGRCWRLPNVSGFEDVNIAAELRARIGCSVNVENDAIAAALAERLFGWGNTYRSFLLVTLGTGIGGGLVLDGNVRRGASGFAGEIGHVMVDSSPEAALCGCGRTGCLEAYAGARALLRRFTEQGGNASEVREIAESPGTAADTVWQMMGNALGTAFASINNTLDLDAIVLTGGISNSFQLIEQHLRKALRDRAFAPPLATLPLLISRLGEHAGVVGAAHLPQE